MTEKGESKKFLGGFVSVLIKILVIGFVLAALVFGTCLLMFAR